MSVSPEHPDPLCPDCHGSGRVPFPGRPEGDITGEMPCWRCKSREYDSRCWRAGVIVTMTPGHPCSECGRHDHDPLPTPPTYAELKAQVEDAEARIEASELRERALWREIVARGLRIEELEKRDVVAGPCDGSEPDEGDA